MPYVKGSLGPRQIAFFHLLEEGEKTPDEILKGMKIRLRTFGAWMQVGKFARRYQMTIRNLKAQAEAMEAVGRVRRARKEMNEGEGEAVRVARTGLAAVELRLASVEQSAMARRMIELHGSAEAVAEKAGEGGVKGEKV